MDETLPATRPSLPLAERLTTETIAGLEGVDRKVLGGQFSRGRIQQAIRSDRDKGGEPGQWRLGDRYLSKNPAPRFVILRVHTFRSLMEGEDKDKKTVCASRDGKQPLPTMQYPRHSNCIDCDYAQWTDGPDGKRKPPLCREGIAFFGVLPDEEDTPMWILNQGFGAFVAAKELLQGIRAIRGIRSVAQPVIQLHSKQMSQTNSRNGVIYYDPVYVVEGATEGTPRLLPVERYIEAVRVATEQVVWEPLVRESAPPDPEAVEVLPPVNVPWDTTEL